MQTLVDQGFKYLMSKAGYVEGTDSDVWEAFHAEGYNIIDRSKDGFMGPTIFDLQKHGKSIRAVEIRTDMPRMDVQEGRISVKAKTRLRYGKWVNGQFVRD